MTAKRTYKVTLPDGTVATRASTRTYTHAVVVVQTEASEKRCAAEAAKTDTAWWRAWLERHRAGCAHVNTWSQSAKNAARAADQARRSWPGAEVIVVEVTSSTSTVPRIVIPVSGGPAPSDAEVQRGVDRLLAHPDDFEALVAATRGHGEMCPCDACKKARGS